MSQTRNMRRREQSIARKAAALASQRAPELVPGFAAGREADARWFEQRPHATWRLRDALPGEAEAVERHQQAALMQLAGAYVVSDFDAATATHILVEQIQPGLRSRIACLPPPEGPERDSWVADVLADRGLDVRAQHLALSPEARATASTWAQLPPDASIIADMLETVLIAQGKAERAPAKSGLQ